MARQLRSNRYRDRAAIAPMLPLPPSASRAATSDGELVNRARELAWLVSGESAFTGGSAQFAVDVLENWRVRCNPFLLNNTTRSSFGPIDLTVVGGSLGLDRVFAPKHMITIGPALSIAAVRAQGHSIYGISESPQTLPLVGVGGRIALEVPVVGALRLAATVDLGYALHRAAFSAGSQRVVAFSPMQAGWTAGFVFQP